MACSTDGNKVVAATGAAPSTGSIYTSTNRGGTWTKATVPNRYWVTVASSADGTRLIAAAAGPGPLYTSADSGATWTSNSLSPKVWSSVASSADGTKLIAAVKNGGIYTFQTIPALSISTVSTNIILNWPSNASSAQFVLQQNSNLAPANWVDTGTTPAVVNQQYQVTYPAQNYMFYRLIAR